MKFRILGIATFRIFRKSVKMRVFRLLNNRRNHNLKHRIHVPLRNIHRKPSHTPTSAIQRRNCRLSCCSLNHCDFDRLSSTTLGHSPPSSSTFFLFTRDFSTFLERTRFPDGTEDAESREKGRRREEEEVQEEGTIEIGTIKGGVVTAIPVPNTAVIVPSSKMSSTNATKTPGYSRPRARRATRSASGAPGSGVRPPSRTSRSQTVFERRVEEGAGNARRNAPQHTVKNNKRTLAVCALLCVCVVHVSRARAVLRSAFWRFASRTAHGIHSINRCRQTRQRHSTAQETPSLNRVSDQKWKLHLRKAGSRSKKPSYRKIRGRDHQPLCG